MNTDHIKPSVSMIANPPEVSAMISLPQTRLHEADLPGKLTDDGSYEFIKLPREFAVTVTECDLNQVREILRKALVDAVLERCVERSNPRKIPRHAPMEFSRP